MLQNVMEDGAHFLIMIDFLDLIMGQSYEFMAGIMNPSLIFRLFKHMLSAVIVRLDRKRFLMLEYRNFVVIYFPE